MPTFACALILYFLLVASAVAEVTLGNTAIGATLDSGDSNSLNGSKVTVGNEGFIVTSINAYVGPIDVAPYNQFGAAIYTDNNGVPGSLVANSQNGTLTANAWNSVAISAVLQANATYWLMYNSNGRSSSVNNMFYGSGNNGDGAYAQSPVAFGNWPAAFGSAVLHNGRFSLYASGGSNPDSSPPNVSIIAPTDGATVSSSITVTANASDDTGVANVQFKVDGINLGAPLTNLPYTRQWNTTTNGNGAHTLSATATDGVGNQTSTQIQVTVDNGADIRAVTGEWSPVMNWPIVAIHAVLLKNGKVLIFDDDVHNNDGIPGSTRPRLWDPLTNTIDVTPIVGHYLFCAGQVNLADGSVFTAGGHAETGGEDGIRATYLYDADTNTWTRSADMAYDRWYPAVTKLSDGRAFIVSGQIVTDTFADIPEIYAPQSGSLQTLSSINTSQLREEEYPADFHLPNGKVLAISPEHGPVQLFDPQDNSWTNVNTTPIILGSAVQFRPGEILMSGGGPAFGSPSVANAAVLDMNASTPAWRAIGSMNNARYMHNLVMLPDGTVLAVGGATLAYEQENDGELSTEIWNPATESWTVVASMSVPRIYHSTALLLPDGRVLSAGGGHNGGLNNQYNAQVYSPPYLFQGSRPTITSAPLSVPYGNTQFTVDSTEAANISAVVLVALGAVTHSTDMNQYYTELPFTIGSGQLTVTGPQNGDEVPPGYYMLFLRNSSGIPSIAQILKVGSEGPPPQPPTLLSIEVTPADTAIQVGTNQQFTARGSYSNNSIQDLTGQVAWSSSDTATASIDAAGLATGVSTGTSTISATFDGVTGSTDLTVQIQAPPPVCPCTIWPPSTTPALPNVDDGQSLELGVRFRSDVDGEITGIRFYKGSLNTGTHVGNLWSNSGSLLGTVTFSGETASGWQEASFANPVPITANTVYIASYFSPAGVFAFDNGYFTNAGFDNPPLHALQDGVNGGNNGVFLYASSSSFPTNSYNGSNYSVDVVFTTDAPPAATLELVEVTPANATIGQGTGLQFTATGTYSNNSIQDLTGQVAWSSSDTAIASINAAGLATGVGAGTTTISATFNGVTGNTDLTVESQPPPPPSGNTLGLTSIGSHTDTHNSNSLNGSVVTTGNLGGNIVSMSVYVGAIDPNPANRQFQVAIYADNNGVPSQLLANSASGQLVANAWNTVAISASLQPNTSYWLIYNSSGSQNNTNNMYYDMSNSNGTGSYSRTAVSFGTWPNSFPTANLTKAVYSLYATLAP